MKWLWIILFALFVIAGLTPQLRTTYQPLPAVRRIRRRAVAFGGARWVVKVEWAFIR